MGLSYPFLDHQQQLHILPVASTMLGSPVLTHPDSQDISMTPTSPAQIRYHTQPPVLKSWLHPMKISHLLFTTDSYSYDDPPTNYCLFW